MNPEKKEGITKRPNGADYNPEELLQGSKRYVGPFSDGQVLDRATVPLPTKPLVFKGFTPLSKRRKEEADGRAVRV